MRPFFKAHSRAIAAGLASAILVLAAVLRLWNLNSNSFTFDAATLSNLAAQVVEHGRLPMQGMVSSTGVKNPPLGIYVLSVPMLVSRDPTVIAGFVACLNIAAVWGTYWLGSRYWNRWVGLLAALLFAVSPWAIERSRNILGQDLLAPGGVLFFAFLMLWLVDRKNWALGAAIVTLAAIIQLHLAAIALIPLMILLILADAVSYLRRQERVPFLKPLLSGVLMGGLLYVPYLMADANTGWDNIRRVLATLQGEAFIHREALDLALMNIGGRNIHSLAGPERFREYLAGIGDQYWPDRIEEALVVLAFFYLFVRLLLDHSNSRTVRRNGLLLLWLATPWLFFVRSSTEIYFHYFVIEYSAPYLVLAAAAYDVVTSISRRSVQRAFVGGVAVAAIALAVWQSRFVVTLYDFIDTHDTPGGKGTPVRFLKEVAQTMGWVAGLNEGTQVLVLCDGVDPNASDCPAAFAFLAGDKANLVFDDYNDRRLLAHSNDPETLAVLAPGQSLAASELPRFATPIPGATIPLREGREEYLFYRIHNYYRDLAEYLATTATSDDAIVLVGPDQRAPLDAFYQGTLPIYELPEQPHEENATQSKLEQLASRHRRIYTIYQAAEVSDPEGSVDQWLTSHAYASADTWLGPIRLVTYTMPQFVTPQVSLSPDAILGDQLRLVTLEWPGEPVTAGGLLPLSFTWQAVAQPSADLTLFVQLLDTQGQVQAQRDVPLTQDGRPTSEWQIGEQTESRLSLSIPPGLTPGDYRLIVGLYDAATGTRLMSDHVDHLDLGPVALERPSTPYPLAQLGTRFHPQLTFDDITLVGHDRYKSGTAVAPDTPLHPGDSLHLVFDWRADEPVADDRSFTVRLSDGQGKALATLTAPLVSESYGSSQWQPGDVVRGEHEWSLPHDLAPGRYLVQISASAEGAEWSNLGFVVVSTPSAPG